MIPLGLKETKEIDVREPFKVSNIAGLVHRLQKIR
jgi:hypothetical protein